MPVTCATCKQEYKNEHGLKIHVSKKHTQVGKTDHRKTSESGDTEHDSGNTTKRVAKTKEGNDDKHYRRPSTTSKKDDPKKKSYGQPKPSCTEEKYRKPRTVQHEPRVNFSNGGDAHGSSTEEKPTKTSTRTKTKPPKPIKAITSGKYTSRVDIKVEQIVPSDEHREHTTTDKNSQQSTLKLFKETKIVCGKQNKAEELSDIERSTSILSYSSLPCPVLDVSKYISMLEASIIRRRKDSELRIDSVNKFINNLVTDIGWSDIPLELFKSGSYYDKTKIDYDDEFDFMFFPKSKFEAVFENCPPGFCKIRKGRTTSQDLDQLFNEDVVPEVVPERFKEKMFSIFENCITSHGFRESRRTTRKPRQPESPAFTILYDLGLGKDKPAIDIDLVPCVRIETWRFRHIRPEWLRNEHAQKAMKCFHVVTKTFPGDHPDRDLLWRISFSHAEKELILHANQIDKGCRKDIFKLLKKIKEIIKSENPGHIDKFCSYHLKMFMLRFYDRHQDFSKENKEHLFKQSITELINCLREGKIENYFIPSDNILQFVSGREKEFIAKKLRKIQEEC